MAGSFGRRWRALALAAGALAGCAEPTAPPNVLLLSVDTLRSDHLGCYGYVRDTSPKLDAFARGATRYADALAPAPSTLPSHAGMLTGRHPAELGVVEQKGKIPREAPTLAELFSAAGYQTAAFVDSRARGFLGGERGFARGFDLYAHAPHTASPRYIYDMATTVQVARRWLDQRDPARPFFLFLHTKSVHTVPMNDELRTESDAPYHKPVEYREMFLEGSQRFRWSDGADGAAGSRYLALLNRLFAEGVVDPASISSDRMDELVAFYDGGIRYMDEHFGALLDVLQREGVAGSTIVVVAADHGEAFLEHGTFLHKQVYGPLLSVPLIYHDPRDPQRAGVVVNDPVSLCDIVPTLLADAGLEVPEGLAGVELPRRDGGAERPIFSTIERSGRGSVALQRGRWKLILTLHDGQEDAQLFHLGQDPLEEHPREDQPERRAAMLEELQRWRRSAAAVRDDLRLDEETVEHLRSLGYGD